MKETNIKGPFVRSSNSTTKIMINVIVALIPIILFSVYKNGYIPYIHNKTDIIGLLYPLLFVLISSFSTFIIEVIGALVQGKRHNELKDYIKYSYAFIPGIFLGLILPINTPIYILIFGSIITSVLGKLLFGGFGNNVFNPALLGRLFIIYCYSSLITQSGGYLNSYELDAISHATPLSNLGVVEGIGNYDLLVKPYGSLWNFFVGTIPGCIGETSSLLCLAGLIYLILTKSVKWKIPVCYITTVFIITFVIGISNGLGLWYPLFQILSGGLMFGSIFMATDPVTSPVTKFGQVLYGIFLGILTVIFRYLTPYPEGVLTSILTMNMFVFIIDKIGVKVNSNKNKKIIYLIIPIIIIIGVVLKINSLYVVSDVKDPNYNILESSSTKYIVTEKGFSGNIKAEILFKNSKIDSINILEYSDSYFSKVLDANYIDKLIQEQNNIDNLDTVSGATISSTALKKMVINTLNDYEENYEK